MSNLNPPRQLANQGTNFGLTFAWFKRLGHVNAKTWGWMGMVSAQCRASPTSTWQKDTKSLKISQKVTKPHGQSVGQFLLMSLHAQVNFCVQWFARLAATNTILQWHWWLCWLTKSCTKIAMFMRFSYSHRTFGHSKWCRISVPSVVTMHLSQYSCHWRLGCLWFLRGQSPASMWGAWNIIPWWQGRQGSS